MNHKLREFFCTATSCEVLLRICCIVSSFDLLQKMKNLKLGERAKISHSSKCHKQVLKHNTPKKEQNTRKII